MSPLCYIESQQKENKTFYVWGGLICELRRTHCFSGAGRSLCENGATRGRTTDQKGHARRSRVCTKHHKTVRRYWDVLEKGHEEEDKLEKVSTEGKGGF